MRDTYIFIKDYKEKEVFRKSLSDLGKRTFGINLEEWYQSGYWKEKYIPYSIVDNEKVISNISVNKMDFICNGKIKHYIQLGTVMTDKNHRHEGLSRYLMELILQEYRNNVDGIYLFANASVLDFYPKFGFTRNMEYQYSKPVKINSEKSANQIPMSEKADWYRFEEAIRTSTCNGVFEMDNIGLIMFYVMSFMQKNVFYIKEVEAYVIAEVDKATLFIHNVFSNEKVDLDLIINAFGKVIKQVILGFTPIDKFSYYKEMIQKEDATLFVMGEDFEEFKCEEKMFPILSHA